MIAAILLGCLPLAPAQDGEPPPGEPPPGDPPPGDRVVIPVDPDARLPQPLRRSLAALDPARAGWGSEVLAFAADQALERLEESLAGGESDSLGEVMAEGARIARLERGEWRRRGAFEVAALSAPAGGEAGRPSWNLSSWRRVLGEGEGEFEAHFKVLSVERVEEGKRARTALRLELVSRGPEPAQLVAELEARWEVVGHERLRLLSLELLGGSVSRAEAPLFQEITSTVLTGPGIAEQLSPGLDTWRERLDTRVGVGILGHHGIALGDVDGDGIDDLYLCQPGGLPNRLFLRRADGTTREVAALAGVDVLDSTQSALICDLDGDGARELVLAVSDRLAIFKNDGQGRFHGVALADAVGATSLAAADIDGDGDLDLFACGYDSPYEGGGTPEPYYDAENGQRNYLLVNEGKLHFRDETLAAGITHRRFSFAAAFEDVDDDGDPDLYVANDFGRNALYENQGDGTFIDRAREWGVEDLSAGMGVAFADVDGDGRMDLHVANMFSSAGNRVAYQRRFQAEADEAVRAGYRRHARGDSLFLHRDGGFVDVSEAAGITMGRWAWGAIFLDLENDGWPDLYVPGGFVTGERRDDL